VQADRAGTGSNVRLSGKVSVSFDVTGAGARVEGAIEIVDADGTGTSFDLHIAGCLFFELDVTGAGVQRGRAMEAVSAHGAGTAGSDEEAANVVDADVSGTAAEIQGNVIGHGDFVID